MRWACASLALSACVFWQAVAQAEPITPRSDAEVVETLPRLSGAAGTPLRRARQAFSRNPSNANLAAQLASHYLELARSWGEPRYAGLGLGVLQAWQHDPKAPAELQLLLATLEQHLHDFDRAAQRLEALLASHPKHEQAWLTLATIRRVQGNYLKSDAACKALLRTQAAWYGKVCLAENQGLRGQYKTAKATLTQLASMDRLQASQRAWVFVSLAELTERQTPLASEALVRWRAALAADDSQETNAQPPQGGFAALWGGAGYSAPWGRSSPALLGLADCLLLQRRYAQAFALLQTQPRTDAVLLRRAMAIRLGQLPDPRHDIDELHERMAQATQRPDMAATHGREMAFYALWVQGDAVRALAFAQQNVKAQREPIDLLLLAQAAQAAGQSPDTAQALARELGLVDARLLSPRQLKV